MTDSNNNTSRVKVTTSEKNGGTNLAGERTLICERALTITVNTSASYSIMRTPGQDRELTVGFLLTEGIINSVDEITMLSHCVDTVDAISVKTVGDATSAPNRNLVVNSSCGLCGRQDIDGLVAGLGVVPKGISIDHQILYDLPGSVRKQQPLFDATGATHAAAIFDSTGVLLVVREDVGRHNAMDKAIGQLLLNKLAPANYGIFLSGRTSLELIIKAARAKLPIIASVSAPTATAVAVAEKTGITIAGFVRGTGFTVYTHGRRITSQQAEGNP